MDEKKFFESLEEVVTNLRNITDVADAQLKASTKIVAALRGSLNGLLFSGMVQLQGGSGNWSYKNDFQVDFAGIGFIDSLSDGPYTIAADAMGASNGPGTFQTGVTLAGSVPLIGKHISITSTSVSATPPQLFIAVFLETPSVISN